MRVLWNDNLKIGIEHIDKQHEEIFMLLNVLYEAIEAGAAYEILEHVVKELIQYTLTHFTAEFYYMTLKADPNRGAHNFEHEEFTRGVNTFAIKLMDGDTFFAKELADFMHGWLTNHITTVDIKLRDL